jgi:hypothetical protein
MYLKSVYRDFSSALLSIIFVYYIYKTDVLILTDLNNTAVRSDIVPSYAFCCLQI